MGILMPLAHGAWARTRGSSFKADPRYTPTSGFATFPWPTPEKQDQRHRVATAAVELLTRRSAICAEREIGLTALYNQIDDGAYTDLVTLHRKLDGAVAAAYGWPKTVAQDAAELVRRLADRNAEIASGARRYQPFGEQ